MRMLLVLVLVAGCRSDAVLPRLDELRVTGVKTALTPAFDPGIFRYSVIADAGPGAVTVEASAAGDSLISIDGVPATSAAAQVLQGLEPGDVVEVRVERGEAATDYEIVYLPPDFPEIRVTVLEDGVSPDPLYVDMNGQAHYVAILDNHGVPFFYRGHSEQVRDFRLHPTGERSYMRATGERNALNRREWENVVLDRDLAETHVVTTVGLDHTDGHEFLILPDGNFIVMAYHGTVRDLTAVGGAAEDVVEDSVIQEIDRATGEVVFEWNSWGHVPYEDQTRTQPSNEYAHVNSIFVDDDGHLLLSARFVSQVIKIARPEGSVIWKLGGKSSDFEFVGDPYAHLCGQHTASRLRNGNLLIFDNGQFCWPVVDERGQETRIVEYRLDENAMTAELVWSYSQEGAYTTSRGSAQRLPCGNTLIGWGRGPDILATEVDRDGNKVFEIVATDGDGPVTGYRVGRFPE